MRQVVLDIEATGVSPKDGHRIVEIGAVEIDDGRITGRTFHTYLNPQRPLDDEPAAYLGLTDEFLADKPLFSELADAFLAFIAGADLVVHNAPFGVRFLDAELERMSLGTLTNHCLGIRDNLTFARRLFPGRSNSLDALCERCGIVVSDQRRPRALLDADLLARIWLAMARGPIAAA